MRNKEKACDRVGIASLGKNLPKESTQAAIAQEIIALNQNPQVDGILVQLPLPDHLDATALLNLIDPDKDVDGLHPINLGRLVRGEPGLRSCTPAGVMRLLKAYDIPLAGKTAVVLGSQHFGRKADGTNAASSERNADNGPFKNAKLI